MSQDREQRIRERAYHLWDAAGRGHGQDREHWDQASREIGSDDDGNEKLDMEQDVAGKTGLTVNPAPPASDQDGPASTILKQQGNRVERS